MDLWWLWWGRCDDETIAGRKVAVELIWDYCDVCFNPSVRIGMVINGQGRMMTDHFFILLIKSCKNMTMINIIYYFQ